jgi:hypothetical protein
MLFLPVLVALCQETPAMPQALVSFERARAQLRTGTVPCLVTGGPGRVNMPAVQYTTRIAKNGDAWYSYDGDSEGVFDRDDQGYPIMVGATNVVVHDDTAYSKNTFSFGAVVAPRSTWPLGMLPGLSSPKVDLRMIGMAPDWGGMVGQDASSVLSQVTQGCTGYSEEVEGTVHHITVLYPDERRIVYDVDVAKGWNATRISGFEPGGTWECSIELRDQQGTWFPTRALLSLDGEPRTEWIVTQAAFNQPDDAAGWGPADVGFEVGTEVRVQGRPMDGKPLFWDGSKAVSREEIKKRLDSGELQPGPTLQAAREGHYRQPGSERLEKLKTSAGVLVAFMGRWEFYVITFCDDRHLNRDQVARAYKCLRRAQERAEQILNRTRPRIEDLQKRRDAGKLSSADAQAEFRKLRAPIDEVFEKDLKPCLEKIPTRARQAVDESNTLPATPRSPASQPAHP